MHVMNVQIMQVHGGGPQICLQYSLALRRAGHQVTAVVGKGDPFVNMQQKAGVSVIKSRKLAGSYDVISMLHVKRLVQRVKPDIIVCHEGRAAALFKRAVGRGIPVVDVNHGRSPKQSKGMAATIVTNSAQQRRTQNFLGGNASVFFVSNGVDLNGYEQPDFPKTWNRPPVIGTIGRLVHEKAIDVFVEALAMLHQKNLSFRARIAGDGDKRQQIAALVKKYQLEEKVKLIGWVKNPDGFYSGIDIFCFPSRQEEFGLVLLEAFKHGLPVVVADSEGPSDIVTNKHDGFIVPKENPEILARAIEALLLNKKKADKLAVQGYNTLVNKYSISVFDKELSRVLTEIVLGFKQKKAA